VLVDLATLQAISYIVGSFGVFVAAIYYIFNMRATLKVRREANKNQPQSSIHEEGIERGFPFRFGRRDALIE